MRLWTFALGLSLSAVVLTLDGCDGDSPAVTDHPAADLFAPTGMRIHPIFTQVEDWDHDAKVDGVEAQLEFQDQFGDPTKAAGRVIFELYTYRKDYPEPRGQRIAGPWLASLQTLDEQRSHWNTTLRTYRFQLNYPAISVGRSYVLSAIFELDGGGRFFDQLVLPGRKIEEKPTTQP